MTRLHNIDGEVFTITLPVKFLEDLTPLLHPLGQQTQQKPVEPLIPKTEEPSLGHGAVIQKQQLSPKEAAHFRKTLLNDGFESCDGMTNIAEDSIPPSPLTCHLPDKIITHTIDKSHVSEETVSFDTVITYDYSGCKIHGDDSVTCTKPQTPELEKLRLTLLERFMSCDGMDNIAKDVIPPSPVKCYYHPVETFRTMVDGFVFVDNISQSCAIDYYLPPGNSGMADDPNEMGRVSEEQCNG